jgi:threonine/homoserine efflux transporter RhtA
VLQWLAVLCVIIASVGATRSGQQSPPAVEDATPI